MVNKTYQEALKWASLLLSERGVDPDSARYVLEMRQHWTTSQLRLHQREAMPEAAFQQFDQDVQRLAQNEPAQYIIGLAPFYGEWFEVTPAVLIPRFETEELVAWVAEEQQAATSGLDLATGSGVVGLTLAEMLPKAQLTLSDVSAAALAVARQNAKRLQRAVTVVQSDLLAAFSNQRFDFIVANLPYISHQEEAVMDQSTLQYEPDLALFADHDGLALFERLATQLPAHLNQGGAVYLEFGYHQAPALEALFKQTLPDATQEFRRDMAGHMRMLKLQF